MLCVGPTWQELVSPPQRLRQHSGPRSTQPTPQAGGGPHRCCGFAGGCPPFVCAWDASWEPEAVSGRGRVRGCVAKVVSEMRRLPPSTSNGPFNLSITPRIRLGDTATTILWSLSSPPCGERPPWSRSACIRLLPWDRLVRCISGVWHDPSDGGPRTVPRSRVLPLHEMTPSAFQMEWPGC